jgi:hypothetical protein
MSCRSKKPILVTVIAALAVVCMPGCAKPSAYKAPVTKFYDASVVVIEMTKTYLTELNKVERDQYIYSQRQRSAADQAQRTRKGAGLQPRRDCHAA